MTDIEYMKYAISLAKQASGFTSPNPLVGAVVVKDGRIIGKGFHPKAGMPHAEVYALENTTENCEGATLYVTLEPCAHTGRTPPCADLIIKKKIKKVFVAMTDPNPLVAGKGIERLKEAGIEVVTGIGEDDAIAMNEGYLFYIKHRRPFIVGKWAMSLDGKIATYTGDSQWISSASARLHSHELRGTYDAMLVGVGTILADNPSLTCRLPEDNEFLQHLKNQTVHQPHCIILDSLGRTPLDSNVFSCKERDIFIFVSPRCEHEKKIALQKKGAKVISVTESNGQLDVEEVLNYLGEKGITSILVEGGSRVLASFIEKKLMNKFYIYIGSTIIGGKEALPAVGGKGFATLADSFRIDYQHIDIKDNTIVITAYSEKG